ncbi:MAG: hypothetical protein R3190_04775 [Thermoanaerobaculia bacterium]|nr:hypothetical protein [Thermoanaerobaculia bacterium]
MRRWLAGRVDLLRLAAVTLGGHRFWLLPLVPLAWPLFQAGTILLGMEEGFEPVNAQGALIGFPLTLLAMFLGIRIIAGEIDGRSLEIAYTVPGGCEKVWLAKLTAAFAILVAAEIPLAIVTWVFFTPFPASALYGALQPATFYLILAMAMATLFRSEAGGAMATIAILALNGLIAGFGENQVRVSPFWNAHAIESADPGQLLAWSLQNRIGVALAALAILSLAFMRANRRERMLE